MTAVAVELSPDLAAAARQRAVDLGVSDRLELIVGNAADVDVGTGLLTAQWSQFFFPEASRAGTLRTLYTALEPTGIVEAPVMGDHSEIVDDPTGVEARDYALKRVVHSLGGIPERTPGPTHGRVCGGRLHRCPSPTSRPRPGLRDPAVAPPCLPIAMPLHRGRCPLVTKV